MGGEVVVQRIVDHCLIVHIYSRGLGQIVGQKAGDVVECRLNVTPQCGDDADGLALQSLGSARGWDRTRLETVDFLYLLRTVQREDSICARRIYGVST